jgi:hypothetical protein
MLDEGDGWFGVVEHELFAEPQHRVAKPSEGSTLMRSFNDATVAIDLDPLSLARMACERGAAVTSSST